MPVRDHDPLSFSTFLGTYDRGEDETVPAGYFKSSQNIQFVHNGVKTRDGTAINYSLPGGQGVRRIAIYKRLGEAPRLLVLNQNGQLYDSVSASVILTIAAMTDFSMVSMFNRAYITPHNGIKGLPGEKVYVYEGSGNARPIAGTAPAASGMTAVEGAAGHFDAGIHLFAVGFESQSGFISKFGSFVALSSTDGGKSVDLGSIPAGPIGTVARVLFATKDVAENGVFDGDYNNKTYYFIPGGRIPDNSTPTKNVAFFDADLQAEASFLQDQLDIVPAGVGINIYKGHLIVWGEDLNESIVRVSAPGQPESFDAADGFCTVNPGDSGSGVKYCFEYRTQLICCKDQRSYVTQDNGNPAAFWEVNALDKSVGTSCHGVGKILDFGEDVRDRAFIADRSGLQLYTGTFSDTEITFNIADIWDRINKDQFHKVEVAVDPLKALVYCAVPLDNAVENTHMIVGDWQEGLTLEAVKFTVYKYPWRPQTIVVNVNEADKESMMEMGSLDTSSVYAVVEDSILDTNVAIDTWVEFPLLPQGDDWPVYHFAGIRVRVKGSGVLQVSLSGLDGGQSTTVPSLLLQTSPGRPLYRGFNFSSERCSVKLRTNQANEFLALTHFTLFHKLLWSTRPE